MTEPLRWEVCEEMLAQDKAEFDRRLAAGDDYALKIDRMARAVQDLFEEGGPAKVEAD